MLSCKDVSHKASDYLDRNLPWRTRLGMRMHLLICVHCRRYVQQLGVTIRSIGGLRQAPEPDQQQVDDIASMLRQQHEHEHDQDRQQ